MTHDELLAYINEEIKVCDPSCNSHKADNQPWLALRAIVEFHKPHIFTDNDGYEWIYCTVCTDGFETFPCPTIQAIEKELE